MRDPRIVRGRIDRMRSIIIAYFRAVNRKERKRGREKRKRAREEVRPRPSRTLCLSTWRVAERQLVAVGREQDCGARGIIAEGQVKRVSMTPLFFSGFSFSAGHTDDDDGDDDGNDDGGDVLYGSIQGRNDPPPRRHPAPPLVASSLFWGRH